MRILSLLALALAIPTVASASSDDLQLALRSLGDAKMYISQGQSQKATDSILAAESLIYRAIGQDSAPSSFYVCSFTYQNHQSNGRGQTEDQARQNMIGNCMRERPDWGSVCKVLGENPYTTTCVQRTR